MFWCDLPQTPSFIGASAVRFFGFGNSFLARRFSRVFSEGLPSSERPYACDAGEPVDFHKILLRHSLKSRSPP